MIVQVRRWWKAVGDEPRFCHQAIPGCSGSRSFDFRIGDCVRWLRPAAGSARRSAYPYGIRNALALAAGEFHATFSQHGRRKPLRPCRVGEVEDEVVGFGALRGGDHLQFVAGVRGRKIRLSRTERRCSEGVLRDHADLLAQAGVLGDVGNNLAVDQDAAVFDIVKTQQRGSPASIYRRLMRHQADFFSPGRMVSDRCSITLRWPRKQAKLTSSKRISPWLTWQRLGIAGVGDGDRAGEGADAVLHRADLFRTDSTFPHNPGARCHSAAAPCRGGCHGAPRQPRPAPTARGRTLAVLAIINTPSVWLTTSKPLSPAASVMDRSGCLHRRLGEGPAPTCENSLTVLIFVGIGDAWSSRLRASVPRLCWPCPGAVQNHSVEPYKPAS